MASLSTHNKLSGADISATDIDAPNFSEDAISSVQPSTGTLPAPPAPLVTPLTTSPSPTTVIGSIMSTQTQGAVSEDMNGSEYPSIESSSPPAISNQRPFEPETNGSLQTLSPPTITSQVSFHNTPSMPVSVSQSDELEKGRASETNHQKQGFLLQTSRTLSHLFSDTSSSSTAEPPKFAIRQGLLPNWFKIVPHLAAASVTIGVVQLSLRNAYWMDLKSPTEKITPGLTQGGVFNFFQLAAKLHELLILTSISSIVLHVAQIHLTGDKGLPLGMISNAFELGSAQFLRRKSFWTSLWMVDPTSGKRNSYKRFWLLCLFSTILVVLSGPSSAIAILPTLNFFSISHPFEETVLPYYVYNESTELWPARFSSDNFPDKLTNDERQMNCSDETSDVLAIYCPLAGRRELSPFFRSLTFQNISRETNTTLRDTSGSNVRTLTAQSCDSNFDGHASASSLTSFLSIAMNSYWQFAKYNFRGTVLDASRPKITLQPEADVFGTQVETICNAYLNMDDPDSLSNMTFPLFDHPGTVLVKESDYRSLNYSGRSMGVNLTFVELPASVGFAPSIGLVLALPQVTDIVVNGTTIGYRQNTVRLACSIYAQWAPVDIWYEPTVNEAISYSIGLKPQNTCLDPSRLRETERQLINITIGTDYTDYLTQPFHVNLYPNSPEVAGIGWYFYWLTSASTNNLIPGGNAIDWIYPYFPNDPTYLDTEQLYHSAERQQKGIASFASFIISSAMTDALARVAGGGFVPFSGPMFLRSERGENGTLLGLTPQQGSPMGSNWTLNTNRLEDASRWLRLDPVFTRYGYGYRWDGSPTIRFGIIVLLIHTALATIYAFYILSYFLRNRRGGLPRSWETIPELFALAMNSTRSSKLKNASAGIEKSSTWGVAIAVRETKDEQLEAIAGKEEIKRFPKVKIGIKYG